MLPMVPTMLHLPAAPIRALRSTAAHSEALVPTPPPRDALQQYMHAPFSVHVYKYHSTIHPSALAVIKARKYTKHTLPLSSSKETPANDLGPHSSPSSPTVRYMLASSFRPLLRTASTAPRFAFPRSSIARSMASTSAPLQEWLVIVPDHEGALQKRIGVRQDHLAGLKKDDESFWLWGGTFEPPLCL